MGFVSEADAALRDGYTVARRPLAAAVMASLMRDDVPRVLARVPAPPAGRGQHTTTPISPHWHGVEPALLVGELVDQHIEEQPYLGAQLAPMRIEGDDLQLLGPVVGQQRH